MTLSEAQPTTSSLQQTLANVFGYTQFRAGQEAVIQQLLEGRDTLVLMPTGGGKSLCYQLPAIHQPGLTVVISPLLSLMQDQVEALQAMGVAAEGTWICCFTWKSEQKLCSRVGFGSRRNRDLG